jgi:hypothetical protein
MEEMSFSAHVLRAVALFNRPKKVRPCVGDKNPATGTVSAHKISSWYVVLIKVANSNILSAFLQQLLARCRSPPRLLSFQIVES